MAFAAALPAIISAAGSVAGGLLGRSGGGADIGAQQQFSMQQAQMNIDFQRELAQNGIRYRVDDAARAGVSPLVALGAPTFNPGAVTVGAQPDYSDRGGGSLGPALSRAGQSLGDAVGKIMTPEDKAAAARIAVQQEQNDKLFSQKVQSNDMDIALKGAQLAAMTNKLNSPAFPSAVPGQGPMAGQGSYKIVPAKVEAAQVGNASVTAGPPSTESTFISNPDGTVLTPAPNRPEVTNNASPLNPEYLAWLMRNRISGTGPSPDYARLPYGYTDWKFYNGAWHAMKPGQTSYYR